MDVAFKQEKYVQLPNDAESSPVNKSKEVGCSDQKVDKRSVLGVSCIFYASLHLSDL